MTAVLDDVLPVYRHRERHATQIAAAPEAVWSALHAVSSIDLRLTRLLTGIRALPQRLPGGRPPGGGLPADRGFIEAFLERGYRELRVDPPWTLVAGAAGQPWRLRGRRERRHRRPRRLARLRAPGVRSDRDKLRARGARRRHAAEHRNARATHRRRRGARVPALLVGDPRRLRADPPRRLARRAPPRRTRRDLSNSRDADIVIPLFTRRRRRVRTTSGNRALGPNRRPSGRWSKRGDGRPATPPETRFCAHTRSSAGERSLGWRGAGEGGPRHFVLRVDGRLIGAARGR
jgi:hypothetical protein